MTMSKNSRRGTVAALAMGSAVAMLTGCAADGGNGEAGGDITLSFASSQAESVPNYFCGMELFKERIEEQDLGITVDLFPASQLGPDTERVASLQSGDLDMDLQEAGLATVYPQIGVLGAAYVFDDVDHAFDWIDNHSEDFREAFNEASDVTIIDGWYYGSRTFSSNEPIYGPDDLEGMTIRFPDTPQYLANAEALGANAVAVAYEEIYVALQQGIADGQENPVVGTKSASYDEVQNYISLNEHQVSIHWVTISDATLERMSEEQQEAVFETVREIRAENRTCVEEETETILDEWRANGPLEVIERDEVDREAFIESAEEYFNEYYTGEDLEFYTSIRETAN
ncbi:TRAP transporter substrate-binding protein DctP [Salinibacterium sp. SYSU T00001]|uniref:TRAP transporter substrate-binding protein DctP n=1 Tax=Homoserinimonas sedimenticola TaxID=2986805 RepID=UPI002236728F|nr:TRAP transporter substrate-binding protein DctP [Salinibacterium sedimenticola]MCW4385483.1 TRAP transporter substrate-binding protein DctP [Salinibacterium sedimenticola]